MTPQLDVTLYDRYVGSIINIPGDINVFSIDRIYAADPTAPVISSRAFRDPTTGAYRDAIRPTRTRVHPYFANLLPEGPLRAYLAKHAGVKSVRDFPLLWVLGADLPGALVLNDHENAVMPPTDENEGEETTAEDDNSVLRFSLAGVQLKFSASGNPDRGFTIPVKGMGGHWIVKLPDQRFTRVPENEYAMMTFARAVGIDVPEIGLVNPADIVGMPSDLRNLSGDAYYIKRFDRVPDGGRVHTEDFAQLNGLYPDQKYDHFNFDMLLEQVGDLVSSAAAIDAIRRIVFTVGIGNADMHSKNWSLIYYDGRTPVLAPAYDFVSTVVYIQDNNMNVNLAGTKQFSNVDDDLLAKVARYARLPTKPVLTAAHDMVDRMREVWPKLNGDLPLLAEHRNLIDAHMNSIPLFSGY